MFLSIQELNGSPVILDAREVEPFPHTQGKWGDRTEEGMVIGIYMAEKCCGDDTVNFDINS